jgi:hypothetical protein
MVSPVLSFTGLVGLLFFLESVLVILFSLFMFCWPAAVSASSVRSWMYLLHFSWLAGWRPSTEPAGRAQCVLCHQHSWSSFSDVSALWWGPKFQLFPNTSLQVFFFFNNSNSILLCIKHNRIRLKARGLYKTSCKLMSRSL